MFAAVKSFLKASSAKQQAASDKLQAASLTNNKYRIL